MVHLWNRGQVRQIDRMVRDLRWQQQGWVETEHGRMPERDPVREPHRWTLGCRRMSLDSSPHSGSRSSRGMGWTGQLGHLLHQIWDCLHHHQWIFQQGSKQLIMLSKQSPLAGECLLCAWRSILIVLLRLIDLLIWADPQTDWRQFSRSRKGVYFAPQKKKDG